MTKEQLIKSLEMDIAENYGWLNDRIKNKDTLEQLDNDGLDCDDFNNGYELGLIRAKKEMIELLNHI